MIIWTIIAVVAIVAICGYIGKKIKMGQNRHNRGGAAYVADDSKWAGDKEKYGRHQEYAIVVNDVDKYLSSLVNNEGKKLTWKKFQEYKVLAANYEYETLVITTYGIFVEEEYIDKFYFYCNGLDNTTNVPTGYRFALSQVIQSRSNTKKFCPFCGIQLDGEFKFCPKCGKNL